jgi:DNA repair protein RecO
MHIEALVVTKAIVREHDQLVTLYARELGKTTAVAKSILKGHSTQALALDNGNLIRCELVPGRGTPIITGAQSIACFSSAKSSPVRWAAAQFFLQVVDAMVYDHQEDAALFECLRSTLAELDGASDDQVLSVFRRRQAELLGVLGYGAVPDTGRALDDAYERIAQRHLATLTLFYDMMSHYAR